MKILVTLILLLTSTMSWSCQCVEITDEIAYKNSNAVLIVQILESKLKVNKNNKEIVQAKFKVVEILKGEIGGFKILQSTLGSTCSSVIITGHKYLIYSNGQKIKNINGCSKSRWLNEVREVNLIEKYRAMK